MALYVNGLTKTFGEKTAVDNISFEMTEPGVFGLIGTNGAGKTTTIRMILGIMRPDSGSSEWDGRKISRETLSFGYMPEERGIYVKNPVLEQLIYFGMLRRMSRAEAKRSAEALLERLGISEYAHQTADKLSKGNQQKVQLAATLIHNPTLIFLDEPFSGLDPVNVEALRRLIHELVGEGKYIVMSSHQMQTVEEYCENLVLLHHGRTLLSGSLRKIKAGYGITGIAVSTDGREDEVRRTAEACGLSLREERADGFIFSIPDRESADRFLASLTSSGIFPTKYEILEPSLNEIFIDKVGNGKEGAEK